MPEGLVGSFLNAFQGLTQMERERKRDEQQAVQQSVENAMRQHAQEQEGERIKQEGAHYQALEAQAREAQKTKDASELRQEKALAETERKNRAAEQGRAAMLQQREKELSSKWSTAKFKAYTNAVLKYTLQNIPHEYASILAEQEVEGIRPPADAQQQMQQPPLYGPLGMDTSIGGGAIPQGPGTAFGSAFGQQPQRTVPPNALANSVPAARAAHLNALTGHTLAETQDAHRLNEATIAVKEATVKSVTARALRDTAETKLLGPKFEQLKMFQNGRLNIERQRLDIERMRNTIATGGQAATTARSEAVQRATSLRSYANHLSQEFKLAAKAEDSARAQNLMVGNLLKKFRSSPLPAGTSAAEMLKRQTEVIELQSKWDAMNVPDKDGETELGRLTKHKQEAKAAYEEVTRAATGYDNLTSQTATPSGGLKPRPTPATSPRTPSRSAPATPLAVGGRAAPIRVKTPEEARKLKPGTHYITPDGREIVR